MTAGAIPKRLSLYEKDIEHQHMYKTDKENESSHDSSLERDECSLNRSLQESIQGEEIQKQTASTTQEEYLHKMLATMKEQYEDEKRDRNYRGKLMKNMKI